MATKDGKLPVIDSDGKPIQQVAAAAAPPPSPPQVDDDVQDQIQNGTDTRNEQPASLDIDASNDLAAGGGGVPKDTNTKLIDTNGKEEETPKDLPAASSDDPPPAVAAVENDDTPQPPAAEAEPKAPTISAKLDHPIPYLSGRLDESKVEMYYTCVPKDIADFDWLDTARLQKIFPARVVKKTGRKLGARQIPMALLIDAQTDHDKLVVVNWWRGMSSADQADESKELRTVYRAPTRSNDKLPATFFQDIETGYRKSGGRGVGGGTTVTGSTFTSPTGTGDSKASNERQNQQQHERRTDLNWTFRAVCTAEELAKNLCLPVPALYCAEVDGKSVCDVENCTYPALLRNRSKCCVHCRNWYPKKGYTRGGRGYLLLGPQYTNRKNFDPLCVCGDETCNSIGYSSNMVRLPPLEELRGQILKSIGLDVEDPARKTIIKQIHAKAYIAPWHFHPEHRTMQYDGTWKVVKFQKKDTFVDPLDEGGSVQWIGFPPPTYDPKTFLEEEISASHGRGQILPTSLSEGLPDWIEAYRDREEGPATIMERHSKELRKERVVLCREIMERDRRNEILEEENKKLREDLAQARNLRRKTVALRKRKRSKKSKFGKNKRKPMSPATMAAIRAATLTTPEKTDDDDIFDDGENDSSSDDDDGENRGVVGGYHPGLHHPGVPTGYHPGNLFHQMPPHAFHHPPPHNGDPHPHHNQVNSPPPHMQQPHPDQIHQHQQHSLANLSDQAHNHNYQVRWSQNL